jgi:putative intracellular protease/amidase
MGTKALIIATNHSDFKQAGADPTGLWLSELTHFYDVFEAAGYAIDIVSPRGGAVPVDSRSLGWFVLDKPTKARHEDPAFMSLLAATRSIGDVDWQDYDVVYFAGGHGAMWDFAEDEALLQLVRDAYEGGRIVAAVCHGLAVMQNVRLSDGSYLVAGKSGTGFPYRDETFAGVRRLVPYNLEAALKERGMAFSKSLVPLMEHTVVDGRLITGQNPNSATKTARLALEAARSLHA